MRVFLGLSVSLVCLFFLVQLNYRHYKGPEDAPDTNNWLNDRSHSLMTVPSTMRVETVSQLIWHSWRIRVSPQGLKNLNPKGISNKLPAGSRLRIPLN